MFSGAPVVADTINFRLLSAPNADPPQFSLTCTSTGGPTTTVNWTRDKSVIDEDGNHIFSQTIVDTETAEYSNTLTVTGRELGEYVCTVGNGRRQSRGTIRLTGYSIILLFSMSLNMTGRCTKIGFY